ncbi:hypothetical protein QBC35DRAFT_188289 [Podospora australis]|uniref:Fucose-specific lectin n=1 Tax=Podospora australis TaxID=1536484 RepID=A0AAN6WIV1_9PEZI|nr:hypothetical protein QBC35DRAFT_188289 [Podospora australis]
MYSYPGDSYPGLEWAGEHRLRSHPSPTLATSSSSDQAEQDVCSPTSKGLVPDDRNKDGLHIDDRNKDGLCLDQRNREGLSLDTRNQHGVCVDNNSNDSNDGHQIDVQRHDGLQVAHDEKSYFEHSFTTPLWYRQKRAIVGLFITVLVVLGAVLGGVLYTTLPKRSSDEASNPITDSKLPKQSPTQSLPSTSVLSPTPTPSFGLLSNSKLAAGMYTDLVGNNVHAVFFQSNTGELMASRRDGNTGRWQVQSITAALFELGEGLLPMNGTPIAIDYPSFIVPAQTSEADFWWNPFLNLRFISIAERPAYVVGHQDWKEWGTGETKHGSDATLKKLAQGGQMASVFVGCAKGCGTPFSFVLYPSLGGLDLVTLYNEFGKRSFSPPGSFNDLYPSGLRPKDGTGLAMTSYTPASSIASGPAGIRMYVDVIGTLREFVSDGGNSTVMKSGGWKDGTLRSDLKGGGTNEYKSPWLSATSWSRTNDQRRENVLVTLLYSNGTVVLYWYDVDPAVRAWRSGTPNVKNITALAVHGGLRAYCIRDGKIEEYEIDPANPAEWKLLGDVNSHVNA